MKKKVNKARSGFGAGDFASARLQNEDSELSISGPARPEEIPAAPEGGGGGAVASKPADEGAARKKRAYQRARSEAKRRLRAVASRLASRELVMALTRGTVLLVLAFLFDRCEWLLATHPFGIALLCGIEGGVPFVYAGLLLSALPILGGSFRGISVAVATAVLLLRIAVRMTVDLPWTEEEAPEVRPVSRFCAALFREHVLLRMAVSAVASFLLGLYAIVGGGYAMYDLFGALLAIVLSPICTLVYAFALRREAVALRSVGEIVSLTAFLAILTVSLAEVAFYSVALSAFAAMGFTLYFTHRKGIPVGILTGLCFGLAVDPVSAPLYAFAALSFGALRRVSIFMGALSALSVGMAWGFYVYGLSALSSLLPALLSSSFLFCVLLRLGFLPEAPMTEDAVEEPALPEGDGAEEPSPGAVTGDVEMPDHVRALRSRLAEERLRFEERRIEDLCGAFLSVAELLSALSENGRYPSAEEFRRVCDRVCDEFCPGCASCALCWGSEYAKMASVLGALSEELCATGRATERSFPAELRERCHMNGAILLRINEEAGALTASALKSEKAGALSADYGAAASLFRTATRGGEEYGIREERSAALEKFLLSSGVHHSGAAIVGGHRGRLYVWGVSPGAVKRLFDDAALCGTLEELCGFCPGAPELSEIPGGGGLADLCAAAVPRYRIDGASVSRSAREGAREEGLCGDSVVLFDGRDGRSFALLSDGMGSGRNAARLSGICTLFLQKLLSAGADTGTAIGMLNDFLSAGARGESSATVDLVEIDLYSGAASFWKSGAAPSFILREENLFRLTSRTAPVGILPESDVQRTDFRLYDGDVVVMLSDGITDRCEDTGALEALLGGIDADASLAFAAERIADGVRSLPLGEGERMDDRSVVLLRVSTLARGAEVFRREPESGRLGRAV